MIDVCPEFAALCYAKAERYLYGKPEEIARIANKTLPKGDVLENMQELFPGLLNIFLMMNG